MTYFVQMGNGQRIGPFDIPTLQSMLNQGTLSEDQLLIDSASGITFSVYGVLPLPSQAGPVGQSPYPAPGWLPKTSLQYAYRDLHAYGALLFTLLFGAVFLVDPTSGNSIGRYHTPVWIYPITFIGTNIFALVWLRMRGNEYLKLATIAAAVSSLVNLAALVRIILR